jgi:hypothetical protein
VPDIFLVLTDITLIVPNVAQIGVAVAAILMQIAAVVIHVALDLVPLDAILMKRALIATDLGSVPGQITGVARLFIAHVLCAVLVQFMPVLVDFALILIALDAILMKIAAVVVDVFLVFPDIAHVSIAVAAVPAQIPAIMPDVFLVLRKIGGSGCAALPKRHRTGQQNEPKTQYASSHVCLSPEASRLRLLEHQGPGKVSLSSGVRQRY